jgi:hypothetical protein
MFFRDFWTALTSTARFYTIYTSIWSRLSSAVFNRVCLTMLSVEDAAFE